MVVFLVFSFLFFPAAAQDVSDTEEPKSQINFLIIPLLKTAFSGELRWRPDWPADFPPDGFFPVYENVNVECIELSGAAGSFVLRRDVNGRLVEFPYFLTDGYVKVKAEYADTGALQNMVVSFFGNAAAVEEDGSQNEPAQGSEWTIEFPDDFFPYSQMSLGGTFPPAKVSADDSFFYVFFFESPVFFSETWYDSEGNMLVFCKALVDSEDGALRRSWNRSWSRSWNVRSLQIHEASGFRFEDYFFDAGGNMTEVRFPDRIFQALYRNGHPSYWRSPEGQFDLQWDTQGLLTTITTDAGTEYRYSYSYEYDTGVWVERREMVLKSMNDLLVPDPSLSKGIWNRRIVFFGEN